MMNSERPSRLSAAFAVMASCSGTEPSMSNGHVHGEYLLVTKAQLGGR
ncbi:hypothetical protein [Mycobacterium sp. 29Ha]|nr:hypothetical protein [Mycobacterium sp. 29Ha]MDV3132083.1 hypothetical protein [Mycobacterium sp. 29Ha]